MDNKYLTFSRININRAPGFSPPGFSVEGFKPQINIIYGPNAVGKTTIARALSYLIWPERILTGNFSVQGEFTLNKSNWYAEIDADRVSYQRDGSKVLRPSFPPLEQRDRYFIALHELLQKETDDSTLAEAIIRETAGGYQILKAIEELGFKDNPFRKGRVSRNASKKIREYKKAIKKQEALIDEERKLERLYEKLAEIKTAGEQLEIVKQTIEYKKIDKEYKELKSKFENLPETLANLKGDEEDRLEKIEENIRNCTEQKVNAENKYSKAKKVMEDIALTDEGVQESFITEVKNRKERLKSWEEKLEQLQGELSAEESRRNSEQKSFINLINEKKLTEFDSTIYNEFSNFARRAEKVHNEMLSLESLKNFLRPEEKFSIKENIIEKGIHYLQEWLREPEGDLTESNKLRKISLVSSTVIIIMSIYMGYVINPVLFILIIISGGIFWYGTGHRRKHDYRNDAREKFEQLMLTLPDEWETAAVKERLNELYDILAEIKLLKRRKQYWEDRSKEYAEIKKKQEEINQERIKLINQYGVAPDTGEQTLYYLTNRLSRWQDAHSRVLSLNKKIEQYKNTYRELRDNINKMLKNYGYNPATDAAEISANITDLEERNSKFRESVYSQHAAELAKKEAVKKLNEAREMKNELYTNLGLMLNDREKLRELSSQYSNYLNLKDALSKVEHLRKKEKIKLAGYTDLYREIMAKSLLELNVEMKELKNMTDEYKNTLDKISKIEARIDTARRGRSIEEAIAHRDRSLDKLRKMYDSDYNKLTGKVLADFIRNKNTVENRPEVFNKAREIFATISRGNYRLVVENSEIPSFRAIETETGKGKNLEQLSSGTRIQLLIAVRMAFIANREQELALPLYFDETLANADDYKAEAMITAIIELARNGRQCFYFTAQRDEVNKWLTVLAAKSGVEYNVIELTKSKKDNKTVSLTNINNVLPDVEELVAIDDAIQGISHEQYGRELSVPDFNLMKGAESTHLWYIIEDTELIRHFLKLGITKWGQLKTMLETGKVGFIPEDKQDLIKEIKILGCCLEEYVSCWRVGRDRMVDRSVLLDSRAISENFIDEVAELARKVDGDARSIIEELRSGTVKRFLDKKVNALEQYFEEENYINSVDTLSGEQIYARMLSVVTLDNSAEIGEKVKRLFKRLK